MKKGISINSKLNWSFWLSLFAIAVSLITAVLFFWKVGPHSVVDSSTFIGAMTAIIGISVTLVIGFQIYSFISIKDRINEMTSLKDELTVTEMELQKTKKDLRNLGKELNGLICLSDSRSYIDKKEFCNAFQKIQETMTYFTDLDSRKECLNTCVDLLDTCLESAKKEEFGMQVRNKMMEALIVQISDSHSKIKNSKYYWVIKDRYNKIYDDFLTKLESFKSE